MAARKKAAPKRRARAPGRSRPLLAKTPPVASSPVAAPPEIMPLDVMLLAMRELWARAEALKGKPECEDERLALIKQASGEAHKAAVYVHPRIASVDLAGEEDAVEARGVKAGAAAIAVEAGPLLGSRELARRLLFAVAFAENISDKTPTEEKP